MVCVFAGRGRTPQWRHKINHQAESDVRGQDHLCEGSGAQWRSTFHWWLHLYSGAGEDHRGQKNRNQLQNVFLKPASRLSITWRNILESNLETWMQRFRQSIWPRWSPRTWSCVSSLTREFALLVTVCRRTFGWSIYWYALSFYQIWCLVGVISGLLLCRNK